MSNDDSAASKAHRETGSVKIFALLGLAQRAGFLTAGFDAVCGLAKDETFEFKSNGIKRTKKKKLPDLVLVAEDISEKTEKEIRFKIKEVEIIKLSMTKETLTKSIGLKSLVGVVAINDGGFAKAIKKHI